MTGQAFSSMSVSRCPCCGSEENTSEAHMAADNKAQHLDTSNMSDEQIDEVNAVIAKKHGVDAV